MSTPQEPKGDGPSKKSPLQEYIHPSAYSQRHIVSLKGASQWSDSEREAHFKHNRILQEGFLARDAADVVNDAVLCKEDWLTDIVCPSVEASLALHIAANLVVTYTVDEEQLNAKTREIMNDLTQNAIQIRQLRAKIKDEIQTMGGAIEEGALKRFATFTDKRFAAFVAERFAEKYPEEDINDPKKKEKLEALKVENKKVLEDLKDINKPENQKTLEAFGRIQRDIEQKKITNKIITAYVDDAMLKNKAIFGLTEKKPKEKGQNTDSVYLGAAGSGKSTIMRQQMSDKTAKEQMVILATDSYRGVTVPGFEDREAATKTDQIFIRTQDTAYMIKELVQGKLETLEKAEKPRPDILVDGVTLEGWHRKLLVGNKETKSAIAALDDASLIAVRAHDRGNDPNAGPADRGRQVHTTALIEGHANASKFWLSGVPEGIITEMYDTNVPRGDKPKLIGYINAEKNQESIDVLDLSKLATFLGKANLNSEATDKAYLYLDHDKTYHQFTATPPYQAEEILKAVRAVPTGRTKKPSYTLNLLSADGTTFATIKETKGELELSVQDKNAYNDALKGPAKKILTEITQRVIFKETLEEGHQRALIFGGTKAPQAIKEANTNAPTLTRTKPKL